MDTDNSRRKFFGKTVIAGGAAFAMAGQASAQKRTATPSVELLKIGVVGVGENSHMNYSIWPPIFNPVEPENWPVRSTRMIVSHVWDSRPEVADAFSKKYKCETVKNFYDMVGKVDGMIFAGFNESKWWPQLTKPYLEAGIPCVINRPFALSMKKAHEIVALSRKYNTPIMAFEDREYIKEVDVARKKAIDIIQSGKSILGVNSDNSAGYEFPQHGIHGLNFLVSVLGCDVEQASFQADGWWREPLPGYQKQMQWGVLSLQYKGVKFDGNIVQNTPFVATQQQLTGYGSNGSIRIYHTGGWADIENYWEQGEPMNRLNFYFFPAIIRMQKMFETREMPKDYDFILNKTRIFLSSFKSHLEHNGAMIKVADLPDNWEAPTPYPGWLDESIFK